MKNLCITPRGIAAALTCLAIWAISVNVFAEAPGGRAAATNSNAAAASSPPTVYNMQYRYYNKSKNCPAWPNGPADYQANAPGYPEYFCTGILLRATSPSKEPKGGWVPEDKSLPGNSSVSNGGMSFSYIRTDTKFYRLAFNFSNGFTLMPLMGKYAAPPGKFRYTVLCAFPVDGATDNRIRAGCGPNQGNVNSTGNVAGGPIGDTCQNQGLTVAVAQDATDEQKHQAAVQNAKNWYGKTYAYNNHASVSTRSYIYQCGFEMTDGKRGVADFSGMLMAMTPTFLQSTAGTDVNELRVQAWELKGVAEGDGSSVIDEATLPIESFFYVAGASGGLTGAQYDQKLYYQRTGQFVPIVAITLPTTVAADFKFAYHSKDQVVPVPQDLPPHPTCTPGQFDTKC
jgi:hypothetical protein